MSEITLIEAINQALAYEMAHDPDVIVLGEDVAANGGVFRATVGLLNKFGPERVLDTPLAETMIAGMAVGMAAMGLKPIAEFQFLGFIYSGMDNIINHASRYRNRTRGRLHCPLVYRAPYGAGIHSPEHHSESTEALFAHIPGLRVIVPSSPAKAYGLLLAAIRDPDPVIFLEPDRIYRLGKEEVPDNGIALPLGQCFKLKEGKDITLVCWGAMIHETLLAARELTKMGIEAEIIDVASIKPLDINSIVASIEKTGHCIIIHEASRTCGMGAEIMAELMEYGWDALQAPVQRVTGYDVIVPYAQLEQYFLPSTSRIINAVKNCLEF